MNPMNFEVGQPFPLPIQAVGDGGMIQADTNGVMFILRLSRTDVVAVEAFRTGAMELALYEENGVLFFLYKIDGIFKEGWGDAPLGLHTLKPEQRPTAESLADPTLHLYLVESRLGILMAMRQVPMDENFHDALKRHVEAQMKASMDAGAFSARVQAAWSARTSEEMRREASAVQSVEMTLPPPKMH